MKPIHHFWFFIGLLAVLFADFWFLLILAVGGVKWVIVPPAIVLICYIWIWVLCARSNFIKKKIALSIVFIWYDGDKFNGIWCLSGLCP